MAMPNRVETTHGTPDRIAVSSDAAPAAEIPAQLTPLLPTSLAPS